VSYDGKKLFLVEALQEVVNFTISSDIDQSSEHGEGDIGKVCREGGTFKGTGPEPGGRERAGGGSSLGEDRGFLSGVGEEDADGGGILSVDQRSEPGDIGSVFSLSNDFADTRSGREQPQTNTIKSEHRVIVDRRVVQMIKHRRSLESLEERNERLDPELEEFLVWRESVLVELTRRERRLLRDMVRRDDR